MSRCTLCESPAVDDVAVKEVIDETVPADFDETDQFDAVRCKRELEDEFDVSLTVSETKRHIVRMAQRIRRNKRLIEISRETGGERR